MAGLTHYNRQERGLVMLDLVVIASAVVIFLVMAMPPLFNAKRDAWESRAKATLRSLGETQYAYSNSNDEHHFGSWEALWDTQYLAPGYNRTNIIEMYSVWLGVDNEWGNYTLDRV